MSYASGASEVMTATTVLIASAAKMLLTTAPPIPDQELLRWLLLPMIGTVLATAGAFLLNPSIEKRRIVFGRSVFAMVFGIGAPQVAVLIFPSIQDSINDPRALIFGGFVMALLAYFVSKPLVEKLAERSGNIADGLVDRLDDRKP